MDPIKEAFLRAKQDIQILSEQIYYIIDEINQLKSLISQISSPSTNQQPLQQTNKQLTLQSDLQSTTDSSNLSTNLTELSNKPTDDMPLKPFKPHIYRLSTGNDGVPTNKPTNQHPNTSTGMHSFSDISNVLTSLDTIKKELRNQFKRLTKQEMIVFSTLYQLEEEGFDVDYPLIAKKLSLSESSIRDYIQKITKKGIPIQKFKENNKKIYLKVSQDLKKITSLETLIQLREI